MVEAGFPEEIIHEPSREQQAKVNDTYSRQKIWCDAVSYQADACVFIDNWECKKQRKFRGKPKRLALHLPRASIFLKTQILSPLFSEALSCYPNPKYFLLYRMTEL